jgi:hypothetical protein
MILDAACNSVPYAKKDFTGKIHKERLFFYEKGVYSSYMR